MAASDSRSDNDDTTFPDDAGRRQYREGRHTDCAAVEFAPAPEFHA